MTTDHNIRRDMMTSAKRDMNKRRGLTATASGLLAKAVLVTLLFLTGGMVNGTWANL